MENRTTITICLVIIVCIFIYLNNDITQIFENFTSTITYNKYPETMIEKEDGLNMDRLYSNYEGKLKGEEEWEGKTLEQCKLECAKIGDNCIGFSRDNIDDDMEGKCYPRTNLSICHTIRKGDANQKENASHFNTFIKSNKVSNQKTKCLGSDNFTLNRLVYINSYAKPDFYIRNNNGIINLKNYRFRGSDFVRQSQFKIVEGLAGEGTVSIQMVDNNDENYYLSDDGNNRITILPVRTGEDNRSTLTSRNRASFELVDGFADSHYVSFKSYSLTGNNKYLMLYNETTDTPKLKLVARDVAAKEPKLATFDIVDNITRTSIVSSNGNDFTDITPSSNKFKNTSSIKRGNVINKANKNGTEKFQGTAITRITQFEPPVELHFKDGTILPIYESINDIGDALEKHQIEAKKINILKLSSQDRAKLRENNVYKVFINKENALVGLYSENDYKSHSNEQLRENYVRELRDVNTNGEKILYSKFDDKEKPNLVMQNRDLFDFNPNRRSGIVLVTTNPNRGVNGDESIKIQDDEKKLANYNRVSKTMQRTQTAHGLVIPDDTNTLNIKSIKIYDNIVNDLKKDRHGPKMNIYRELRAINDDINNNYSASPNLNKYIEKLKNKYNEYKDYRQILTNELFDKQKKLETAINITKTDKDELDLRNIASDYFFVKGLSDEALQK